MALAILPTVLSTVALALAAYACVAHAIALHELRVQLVRAERRTPYAAVAALETRVTELANECAADRSALAKVADRVHRLAGRLQGLQRADSLNADPPPADRDQLRSALLKGHHVGGTPRE